MVRAVHHTHKVSSGLASSQEATTILTFVLEGDPIESNIKASPEPVGVCITAGLCTMSVNMAGQAQYSPT